MKTLPPPDLQDAFDFVCDTFYPRWKRAEWRVVEGTPLPAPGFCGLCDPETKTITVSPHVVADTPLELVTILAFRLDEDGKLIGQPRVMSQSGVTDSNRPQVSLHAERAIRAVQLAAPFDLPPEYYNAWKNVSGARFDRNLSR